MRITEDRKSYARAELLAVLDAAHERVEPRCQHFGACGGCSYQHADDAAQLRLKQIVLRETLERAKLSDLPEMDALVAEPWGYRNRIRFAVDGEGRVGYRGRRSHGVIAAQQCPIAAPLLVRAALRFSEVKRAMAANWPVREISLFAAEGERELLAQVFAASAPDCGLPKLAEAWAALTPELAGVEILAGRDDESEEADREPLGAASLARWGSPSLTYRVRGDAYRVDQGAFFQVNHLLVDKLVERVSEGHEGRLAWDMFAGVGLFARALTRRFDRVVAVESAAAAGLGLRANLAELNARVVEADTLRFLESRSTGGAAQRPDLVIVDPPRAGLGSEVVAHLVETGAPRLVYVSCDPATLARDLRQLCDGGYAVGRITMVDMFPNTSHLETVVDLKRS